VPGSIVGYEKEQDERPYFLADDWDLQDEVPTRETRYTLQLPPGWSYRAVWLNHAEEQPTVPTGATAQWIVSDVPAMRIEAHMPPWRGIAARLEIAVMPPTGSGGGLKSWSELGNWYTGLVRGRRDPSPEIQQKVADLTAGIADPLEKMRALATFVQNDIRYVAIELGIGGHQPHPAVEVFRHRYGDCKDKATLLSAMLQLAGIESYYVIINTERGSITADTPPNLGFNHVILAIRLPDGVDSAALLATRPYAGSGRLLFFDPTDDLTPFGRLSGPLQANFGLLVTPDGGELVELPQLSPAAGERTRSAQLTLGADGALTGEVHEERLGDDAWSQRYALRGVTTDTEQIKPIEALLSASLPNFQILRARVANVHELDKPLKWIYEFKSDQYAKRTGDLLLVRPRVLGTWTRGFLETKEPREHAIEFDGPERDTDVFEIALPAGYAVDDLPPSVAVDYGFASYQSKTELVGRNLRYTRSLEIKDLSVAAGKAGDLKELYRVIAGDERNAAVLKRTAAAD
jgi:transglutaminase-like putative cysteine protease